MLLVVDASCIAAWFLPSQATAAAIGLRQRLPGFDLVAPSILRVELRALLLKAERRGAAAPADSEAVIGEVQALGINYADSPDDDELDLALALARVSGLTLYDALYFQLAIIEGAGIASRDGALIAAARARGVAVEDCR